MTLFMPRSPDELWDIFQAHPEARLMAGGTDLLVQLRRSSHKTFDVICLENIEELKGIQRKGPDIYIGSGTCLSDLLANPLVKDHLGVLFQACDVLGSPLIRNMATIGGNICTASPAGDTLPALYVLDARLELISAFGCRTVPVSSFIKNPGRTDLKPGEILATVIVPVPEGVTVHHFEKVGQRNALAISIASLAALLAIENGVVRKVRLAWGSVGPVIIQSRETEKILEQKPLLQSCLKEAAVEAQKAVMPISDVRASEAYRREVCGNLLLRLATD